jgi:hypothetical protein
MKLITVTLPGFMALGALGQGIPEPDIVMYGSIRDDW